jgi:hypothetical protein
MSKYADFEFVKRCIYSCTTLVQTRSPLTRLMRAFRIKHDDNNLWLLLCEHRDKKFDELIKTNLKTTCRQDILTE